MLDYFMATVIFMVAMAAIQEEWLLKYHLGYHGRFWTLAITLGLFVAYLLSAAALIVMIGSLNLFPFEPPGSYIFLTIATVFLSLFLWLAQWIILRQQEPTPRIFAALNTAVAVLAYLLVVRLNINHLDIAGDLIKGWKTAIIFAISGAATGAVTSKALDFYCQRQEQRLLRLEREAQKKSEQDESNEED
ncbi:hypothetical protein [Nostoc sp. MS1]|uniref:hypothetical protein n=1 Tax=Nostoc sp. MS1 TaxID=2764711 RepID=UPI001CC5A71E|nr:hypothetical protein [Nostoc sp. MS1]BCL40144.1 hypothetical protein NSMS1_65910 [Nostoc sp. MS1]